MAAFSRAHLFPLKDQELCMYLKALAYPARSDLVLFLEKAGPQKVETIRKRYNLSRATQSQHLKILRKSKLLDCEEVAPYTYYFVNKPTLNRARKLISEYLAQFSEAELSISIA